MYLAGIHSSHLRPPAGMHSLRLSPSPFRPSHHLSRFFHPSPPPSRRPSFLLASPELRPLELTTSSEQTEGPIELPPSPSTIFSSSDDPTPLQLSTSVLLTGAISVFLFRSLRRRAKRAKEMRVRSTGVKGKDDVKEIALESLKALSSTSLDSGKDPSPVQAFLGGLAAGAVALILYQFTTTVEASLNRQTMSDNFSVQQITITVRTIINGLCYLATFIFGINSIGLLLYSVQLAFSSITEPDSSNTASGEKNEEVLNSATSTMGTIDNTENLKKDE